MLTWQLWNTLHTARPRHPLFRLERYARTPAMPFWRHFFEDFLPLGVLIMMVVSAWMLALLVIAGFMLLLVISGFLYGFITAVGISRNLSRHRATGRYELISLTPGGVFEIHRAISAYFLQRVDVLGYIREIMTRLYLGAAILLSVATLLAFLFTGTLMMRQSGTSVFEVYLFPTLLNGLLIVGMHYLDFTRSALTGILIGMLTPTFTGSRSESYVVAILMYSGIQILVYGVCWICATTAGQIFAGVPSIMVNLMLFGGLLVMREITLQGLWYLLLWRLNVSPAEARAGLHT